ncbi:MAG: putative ribosomal protein S6 modification protein [uncultured bacterium]|nr:MAG: putative ribosomal protein S6 modification protein [uncultured bacterium]
MKNVVIMYAGDDWKKEIPISNEGTRLAIQDWMIRAEKKKVNLYRASMKWYECKKNVFSKAWAFRDGAWKKIESEISPDMIYDKVLSKYDYSMLDFKLKMAQKTLLFNSPLFRATFNNKLSQYVMFGEFMPFSQIADNKIDLERAIKESPSEKIVVKPLYGSGGFGIFIGEKEKALERDYNFPVLVQEFVVSEKGVPGFSTKDEIADLRLVFQGGKLAYSLSRIAKEGSLFTNLHQGATGKMVPIEKIPNTLDHMVEIINKKISVFPNAQYSLDFIFDNEEKPYFIEMNTCPGIDLVTFLGDEKTKQENFESIMNLLK